jgi:hypothetical protein
MFRTLSWMASLAAVIAGLVVGLARVTPPERPRFDEPGAAGQYEQDRRRPLDPAIDAVALYERAASRVAGLERFSSAINRTLPASHPQTRVWLAGDRAGATNDRSNPTAILDAWTPLGPGNIGGRTRVVRYHPTVPTTIFAAGVSGGVWKSDDDGTTWRPSGDGLTNMAVNSLAIDPQRPSTIYAGTGEGYFREEIRGTGLPLRGGGIYASTNGGTTWQRLAATNTSDFHWVNDLELGVGNSSRIYAATRTGVWRSLDGGGTFTRILETSVRGGCLDLALRPDRTEDVLFASCGSYEQATVYRFPRASDRSDVDVVLREPNMGRTSLAIAPSNPDVIYALAASNDGGPGGNYRQALLAVYRSDRGGTAGTWETRVTNQDPTYLNTLLLTNVYGASARECGSATAVNNFTNMGWYINVIAVDPRDPNRVWAAGVDFFRSDDGGRNWGLATYGGSGFASSTHVDQHAITFHPGYDGSSNQTALIGNDGGIYRTTNARANTGTGARAACSGANVSIGWTSLNRGYGVTQFYHGTPFPDGTRYIAGAQDNGTIYGTDANGPDRWTTVFGGDGGFSAVHPTATSTWLLEYQWANLARTTNGGSSFDRSLTGLDAVISDTLGPDANYLFVTPFAMDPASPYRVWLGGNSLYRSGSAGAAPWSKITQSALTGGALVSAVVVSPSSSQVAFAGTTKGDILRTANGSAAAADVQFQSSRPREGWVTSIAVDPRSSSVVYATYGNFGGAHVYRSSDGGATWRSLDGTGATGLPDIPVHSLVVDPDNSQRLYLGTDLGVMISVDGGATWMAEETGFGPAVTMWLSAVRTAAGEKYLFAFTHGRGAWRVALR